MCVNPDHYIPIEYGEILDALVAGLEELGIHETHGVISKLIAQRSVGSAWRAVDKDCDDVNSRQHHRQGKESVSRTGESSHPERISGIDDPKTSQQATRAFSKPPKEGCADCAVIVTSPLCDPAHASDKLGVVKNIDLDMHLFDRLCNYIRQMPICVEDEPPRNSRRT